MSTHNKEIDFYPHRKRRYKLDEPMHPVQIAGFRKMTAAKKLEMIAAMYRAAIALHVSGARHRHPEWTEDELEAEARLSMLHART